MKEDGMYPLEHSNDCQCSPWSKNLKHLLQLTKAYENIDHIKHTHTHARSMLQPGYSFF